MVVAAIYNNIRQIVNNGIIHKQKHLAYWFVPKNACTSLKKLFADDLGLGYQNIHDAPFERIGNRSEYEDFTHFAVIRNPFDRLLSCYRDKIRKGVRMRGFEQGVAYNFRQWFNENVTFEEFANQIFTTGIENPHWLPQDVLLPKLDVTIPFENLPWHLRAFLTKHGFNTELPHRNQSNRPEQHYREMYSPELKEKAIQYYASDCQRFGYEF